MKRFGLIYCMANKDPQVKYPDPDEVLKAIGARLKELRIANGEINYEKFAARKDLNRSQVWRYENGEDMKITSLLKMLNALDISLRDFFDDSFGSK